MERYFRHKLGDDYIKHISYLIIIILLVVVCIDKTNSSKEVDYVKTVNVIEEDSIKSAIDKVYDSVLVIESYSIDGGSSVGSGFIYKVDNKNGYVLTNYHVVKDSDSIMIIDSKDKEYSAKLLGFDEQMDLAVLCIEKKYVNMVAAIAPNNSVNLGDTVFTVGSPEGKKYRGTVTKGIISGLNREVVLNIGTDEYIINVMQTDAAINPGNSGGPLVNINGEVIGINSLKIVQNEIEGMGFAIPIEEVMLYVDRLENGIEIKRPYLGIELKNSTNGILVSNIKLDAIKSDLKINDIIVKLDDNVIEDVIHFRYLLYKHNIGDKITLEYVRDLKLYKTTILLTK